MNVAIIISGRIELYHHVVKDNYERIINPLIDDGHTVNIFMSVWEHSGVNDLVESYKDQTKVVDIETFTEYTRGLMDNLNEYENLTAQYGNSKAHKVANTLFWLYKLKRGYKLVQEYERVNNMKHDLYIRLRPSATVVLPLDVNQLSELDDDSIYAYEDNVIRVDGVLHGCGNGWIDDNFCIARNRPFELFWGVYDNIVDLCNRSQSGISHILLQTQFQINNIKIVKPNSPLIMYRLSEDGSRWSQYYHFTYFYPWFKLPVL